MITKYEILKGKYNALLSELSDCPLKERDRFMKIHHDVRNAFDDLYFWSISDKGIAEIRTVVQDQFDWDAKQ